MSTIPSKEGQPQLESLEDVSSCNCRCVFFLRENRREGYIGGKYEAWLRSLTPAIGGFVLGSASLGHAIALLNRMFGLLLLEYGVSYPLYIVALGLAFVFLLRYAALPSAFIEEVAQPCSLTNMAAFLMGAVQLSTLVHNNSNCLSHILVGIFGIAHAILCCYFLYVCWKAKEHPKPSWFPPTVGLAVTATAGHAVAFPRALVELFFLLAVIFCLVLVPWVLAYTIPTAQGVAFDPSIFVLAAPVSLIALSWMSIEGTIMIESEIVRESLTILLVVASDIIFLITLSCAFKRRRYVFARFSDSWSSMTFPLTLTVHVALYTYSAYKVPATLSWALLMAGILLPFVLILVLRYLVYIGPECPCFYRERDNFGRDEVKAKVDNESDPGYHE